MAGKVMSKPEKKARTTAPATAPAGKPVKPERYDGRSAKEYEDEGLEQAVEYFRKIGRTFRYNAATAEDVRSAIEALPQDALLQVTMSDFWLGLRRAVGQRRRNNSPPMSPFKKNGRTMEAEKMRIAEWDIAWLAKQAARVFAKSGSSRSRTFGEMLRTRLPWLTAENGAVLACASELPVALLDQAMKQPEKLGLKWMTLELALRARWIEVEERRVWLSRFETASSAVVSELGQLCLEQGTGKVERRPAEKRTRRK